ncbi:MAG: 30S ribosomal protein S12 methylthiotransferase RimO [Clostridia bacterium]
MKRIGVISLGCAKNQVDTERMLGLLTTSGFELVNNPAQADILIVNTCGFIESAKQESIQAILEMAQYKKNGTCETLVVTGCLSERYRAELIEALPEVDYFLGVREYHKLPSLLGVRSSDQICAPLGCGAERMLTTPFYSAYLRVADGCDNICTYCAIPLIRGPLVSEPMGSLIDEAERLADNGVTELTIIAQDTSGYGIDRYGAPKLTDLLSKLSTIDRLKWIRVLYTYPDTVTPDLIDFMRSHEKIVHYLDLPLQHIADSVLTRMNRRGNGNYIRNLLGYIRSNADDFILRTTMMVGFPGETDADFDELMMFLKEFPFDRLGAFTFSPEDGTAAAVMPNQVPEDVKQARLSALMTQQQGISRLRAERRVGQITSILIEGSDETHLFGRSCAEAPDVDGRILLPLDGGSPPIGTYVPVRLIRALEYDMIGELLWTPSKE